jgi:HPt (histidine-containing phosphotransfer) domain-containing protein
MSPQNFPFIQDCPVIDEEVVNELFAVGEDAELVEMQKEIWGGVRADLVRDIEEVRGLLLAGNREAGIKLVHRIAGYTSSAGLSRLSRSLRAVERAEVPDGSVDAFLQEVQTMAGPHLKEMEARFPHLCES